MWQRYENYIFTRIIEGLISVCLSNRVYPVIKCVKGSLICNSIGNLVADFFQKNEFARRECGKEQNGLLIIFDRKEDPITPLLNQWTYQAMIHELIGIKNNILEIKHENNTDKLVLSDYDDKFFSQNLNNDYDEVCTKVKEAVENLNKEHQEIEKRVDTIEEIKKLVEKLPEKKKESAEITKHTNIIYEISEISQNRFLFELSALEQDLACYDKKEHYNRVVSVIKNPQYNNLDKAKIYLLYCLRYEGDGSLNNLKNVLEENGMKEWIEYGEMVLSYAGKNQRVLDVLSNKDFLARGRKFFSSFKNVPNVFTQHKSYLSSIIEKVIKTKTKESEFETIFKTSDKEKY
jgi:vacuolar protein sorting-associated protein 45